MCFTQYSTVNLPQYKYKIYDDAYINGTYSVVKRLPENFTSKKNIFLEVV